MPQDKSVDAMAEIAKSKKLLEGAGDLTRSVQKQAPSPKIEDKPAVLPTKPKPASTGLLSEAASAGAGLKAKKENVDEYLKTSGVAAPKMHKGGKVEEDGVKDLKKGETVLPKDKKSAEKLAMAHLGKKAGIMNDAKDELDEEKDEKKPAAKKAEKKADKKADKKESKPHDFERTETLHHRNGSHTTTHHFRKPTPDKDGKMGEMREPVSYGSPDFASMQQDMQDNLGGGPQGAPQAAPEAAPAL